MPIPDGTVPIGGPLIATAGERLPASKELLDNGVTLLDGGRWWSVIEDPDSPGSYIWVNSEAAEKVAREAAVAALRKEIADEATHRASGDDLQSITIGSLANFNDAISAQAESDQPLEIFFSATIVSGGDTYNVGDLVRYAPKSTSPERRFNLVTHTELAAESRQRSAGDEWREYTGISTVGELNAAIATHGRTDIEQVGIFVPDAAFTTPTRDYAAGQRWRLAPHHNAEGELVLVSEPGGEGGGADDVARAAAKANAERINDIPVYAARMSVYPPNVRKHSDFQRDFQSTLSGLASSLATDAGSTGTRFTNVFRILTRLANGNVVQLHTQGWAFTEDDRQTIPWEVSAAEFNAVGASAATNGVEVWGEFRAVYGGGVDELRGRTDPVFIDFGEEPEWPATRGDLATFEPKFSQAQQIALLSIVADPGSIAFVDADDLSANVRDIRVSIQNPELLQGDVWVQGWTQGQPGTGARTKWASNIAGQRIAVSEATADAIAAALIAGEEGHVEVRLHFFDAAVAGNEIERIGINIPITNISAASGISAGAVTEIDNSRAAGFQGLKVWYGTKAQFDAIVNKDASTVYFYPPA